MLLACPPRKAKRWTEADIDSGAEAELVRLSDPTASPTSKANEERKVS